MSLPKLRERDQTIEDMEDALRDLEERAQSIRTLLNTAPNAQITDLCIALAEEALASFRVHLDRAKRRIEDGEDDI